MFSSFQPAPLQDNLLIQGLTLHTSQPANLEQNWKENNLYRLLISGNL